MIRRIVDIEELKSAIEIQKRAWEFESLEDVIPLPIYVLSAQFGGLVLGAFYDDKMVAFSLAFPLLEGREIVLHSHMTAVLPEFQGKGIGYRLKIFQREEAKKMGYKKITWTFDPLQAKNAHFNINKLGARIFKYFSDFYGPISSKTSKGFPTHRFLVEWGLEGNFRKNEKEPSFILFEDGPGDIKLKKEKVIGVRIPTDINSLPYGKAMKWFTAVDQAFKFLIPEYEIFSFGRGDICYYKMRRK